VREHRQVNARPLVAGEPEEADLTLFPGAHQRLDHSVGCEVTFGIVVVDALVDLPQVQVVGLQAPQRLFELTHRFDPTAAVRADLGHEEHLVPTVRQGLAHHDL